MFTIQHDTRILSLIFDIPQLLKFDLDFGQLIYFGL